MSFQKGQSKPKGSGRKKGTPNKATATFREMLSTTNFDVCQEAISLYKSTEATIFLKFQILLFLASYSYYRPLAPEPLPEKPKETPNPHASQSTEDPLKLTNSNESNSKS